MLSEYERIYHESIEVERKRAARVLRELGMPDARVELEKCENSVQISMVIRGTINRSREE